jgi:hypothetical protein
MSAFGCNSLRSCVLELANSVLTVLRVGPAFADPPVVLQDSCSLLHLHVISLADHPELELPICLCCHAGLKKPSTECYIRVTWHEASCGAAVSFSAAGERKC